MLTEFDMVDHMVLDEENHKLIMLIVDTQELWSVALDTGLFHFGHKRKIKQKQLEHLVCLKKKVENYAGWIQADMLKDQLPDCDSLQGYDYEIHIVTDFKPEQEYLDFIKSMNQYFAARQNAIVLTHEQRG